MYVYIYIFISTILYLHRPKTELPKGSVRLAGPRRAPQGCSWDVADCCEGWTIGAGVDGVVGGWGGPRSDGGKQMRPRSVGCAVGIAYPVRRNSWPGSLVVHGSASNHSIRSSFVMQFSPPIHALKHLCLDFLIVRNRDSKPRCPPKQSLPLRKFKLAKTGWCFQTE